MDRPVFLAAFAPDVPPDVREFMADSQVPIQLGGLTVKAKKAAWHDKPSWYLVSQDDKMIPPDVQRTFARRIKATTQEVAGSHVAYLTHPQVAAKLIAAAATDALSR